MGQIIAFPLPPTQYSDQASELPQADRALLLAMRWWVEDYRTGSDPVPRLCDALAGAGADEAAFAVDSLMNVVARTGRRPIDVHCPHCPSVSDDEMHLLHAASLAQTSDPTRAEDALRNALLSAEGAAFAVGSLEWLGGLFARAHLFLSRRTPPAPDESGLQTWLPPSSLH